jgi:ribbon-helix-helix protein
MALPKEVRVHVLMDEKMYSALRKVNAQTGAPVGEIIRRAVDAHLTDHPALIQAIERESRIVGSPVLIAGRETR